MRGLFGNIIDWSKFYREAFRTCKPGGWFEDHENSMRFQSDDGSVPPGSPMDEWGKVFWEAGKKFGRTFRVYEDGLQEKHMEEAGFVDVTVWEFKVSSLAVASLWLDMFVLLTRGPSDEVPNW